MLAFFTTATTAASAEPEQSCLVSAGALSGMRRGILIAGECVLLSQRPPDVGIEYRTVGCDRTGHTVLDDQVLPEMCPAPVPECQLLAAGGMSGTPFWAYLL
ncbi:MAG: hypothetical protein EPN43_14410, partial [Jatrophihabitans sp.]